MDIMETFRILRRRWILALLMLVIVLAGTVAAGLKLPRTYISNSTVVLLASRNASKPNGGNPYLSFNSSLPLTADVVRRELMDPRTVQSLAKQGSSATYLVAAATDTSGPVLLVTVTGPQKAVVEKTLYGVTAEIRSKLYALQTSITAPNLITVVTLSIDPRPTLSISKLARPLVVLVGLGLILAFAVPLIVDAQSVRRSRKRSNLPLPPKRIPAGKRIPAAANKVPGSTEQIPARAEKTPVRTDKVAATERRPSSQPVPSGRPRYSGPSRETSRESSRDSSREPRYSESSREAARDSLREPRYSESSRESTREPHYSETSPEPRATPNRAE
jgi:capsular polysaccharide biosynthesis protein